MAQKENDMEGDERFEGDGVEVPETGLVPAADRPDSTADRTRARDHLLAQLESGDPKTKRVWWCMTQMTSGRWVPGPSHEEGAEKHGVSVRTMWDDAAEAGRTLHIFALADEQMRPMVEGFLMRAAAKADRAHDEARGADVMVKAAQVLAKIRGYEAPTNVNVTTGASLDDIAKAREAAKANE